MDDFMRFIILSLILGLIAGCNPTNIKPSTVTKPQADKPPTVSQEKPVVKSKPQPTTKAPVTAVSSIPLLTVSHYTTIYEATEYYFDPAITVYNGEAVVALYTIDDNKLRTYRYIPKKDLKEPLILYRH